MGILERFLQCGILELFRQCGILELLRQCGILELLRQCGILELLRQCGILELFRQCGIFCFSIRFLNCYDSVVFSVSHFISRMFAQVIYQVNQAIQS